MHIGLSLSLQMSTAAFATLIMCEGKLFSPAEALSTLLMHDIYLAALLMHLHGQILQSSSEEKIHESCMQACILRGKLISG